MVLKKKLRKIVGSLCFDIYEYEAISLEPEKLILPNCKCLIIYFTVKFPLMALLRHESLVPSPQTMLVSYSRQLMLGQSTWARYVESIMTVSNEYSINGTKKRSSNLTQYRVKARAYYINFMIKKLMWLIILDYIHNVYYTCLSDK